MLKVSFAKVMFWYERKPLSSNSNLKLFVDGTVLLNGDLMGS